MKSMKKYLILAAALVLCLALAACGSGSGNDDGGSNDAPDSFEGLVKDSLLMADLDVYGGTWTGEDGSTMTVEPVEAGDETYFTLYGADGDLTASGFIQSVPEHGCDYFYNAHDGMAYRSWSDEDGTLHVDTLGTFTKVSGDLPGENIGDADPAGDYASLAGEWYLDGAPGAPSILSIAADGSWELYERPGGDGDPAMVDDGTIRDGGEDGLYYADSTAFDGVTYDMQVVDDGVMYWGGEYDCYQRAQ